MTHDDSDAPAARLDIQERGGATTYAWAVAGEAPPMWLVAVLALSCVGALAIPVVWVRAGQPKPRRVVVREDTIELSVRPIDGGAVTDERARKHEIEGIDLATEDGPPRLTLQLRKRWVRVDTTGLPELEVRRLFGAIVSFKGVRPGVDSTRWNDE